jgi:GT2 family glycosyltransferase
MRQFLCAVGLPWIFPRIFGWANVYDVPDRRLIEKHDCDWLGGAFLMIRRTALSKTGFLDEDFFFYGEDVEFCHRMRRNGFRIYYDPTVSIVHRGGASSDPSRMKITDRDRHRWQARYLIQRKCYGSLSAMLIRWADIFTLKVRQTKLLLRRQRQSEPYRGVCEAIGYLRTLRP